MLIGGILEELNRHIDVVIGICKENNVDCFIDIYHEDRKNHTSIDFDCPI